MANGQAAAATDGDDPGRSTVIVNNGDNSNINNAGRDVTVGNGAAGSGHSIGTSGGVNSPSILTANSYGAYVNANPVNDANYVGVYPSGSPVTAYCTYVSPSGTFVLVSLPGPTNLGSRVSGWINTIEVSGTLPPPCANS
ncbi:hypothetical protein GCM10020367_69900 [Streptomyces sannanensis]|uniref:Uncharacterized protein n=1 Tax=Streptomyces sannanensis TaxID=285536 RepID=A0ABP6SNC9_9ACTN